MKSTIVVLLMFISSNAIAQGLRHHDSLLLKQPFGTFKTLEVKPGQAIPQNYYTQCFGFFCRQELKMQQEHIPLTFRLGSMDYCNWLEQKPGYR